MCSLVLAEHAAGRLVTLLGAAFLIQRADVGGKFSKRQIRSYSASVTDAGTTIASAALPEATSRMDRGTKAYSADEVQIIWSATEALPAPLRAIYRLGLLTGQRPGEISGVEWRELDGA